MAPDPSLTNSATGLPLPDPPRTTTPAESERTHRSKFRLRFRKAGDLRLVSHHDLMHVVERMFRRADLTLTVSQGFNPRPKMAFGLSLALGVAGLREILEFEIDRPIAAEEVERRLSRQCPIGLEIVGIRAIEHRQSARVIRARYRVSLENPPPSNLESDALRLLPETLLDFLAHSECWVERTRPQTRRINVRPFVHELKTQDGYLEMALWITPNGAARPEEVLAALGLTARLDAGAVIERTDLEIEDELNPETNVPPRIEGAFQEITANEPDPPTNSRPTAIVDNPMSFDS